MIYRHREDIMVCTFFGHRDCYILDESNLRQAVENLIKSSVSTFYVGNQGHFDSAVLCCLTKLKEVHPHISYFVVLAYLPNKRTYSKCSIYPEGLELVHPRFAIEKRNEWMINQADYCLCYVDRKRSGAYKSALKAKRRGLTVINLGNIII